jgi:hypothetical protein
MAHAGIRVQNNAIDAIVAAAQQILIESAQPVRHGRQVQAPYPSFKLPRRGHFFAAPSVKGVVSYELTRDKMCEESCGRGGGGVQPWAC